MARKPPDWHQHSLFPPDPATSAGQAPADTPEPKDNTTKESEGDQHALQDHSPRTPATTATDARAAAEGTQATDNDGVLREGAEDQSRSLEGTSRTVEAGQRPEPDRERSPGDSPQGAGGSFALRVGDGRGRDDFARRSNGLPQKSHVERVKASR